jgi:heme A synthase
MTAGNVVRVTGAAQACPDWPTCYGQWTLPPGTTISRAGGFQYAHRALALMATLLVTASAAWACCATAFARPLGGLPAAGCRAVLIVESLLGARLVRAPESALSSALHMARL